MLPLIGMPQGWEWLIVLAIFVLVFGAAKLPDLARGTGQALRIFKSETKGLRDDDDDEPKPKRELNSADPVDKAKTADNEVAEGEIVDERKNNA
jgi:sec-independent protein translocase protein TatA